MAGSDDATLMKVAVFGIAMSIVCTAMISIMFVSSEAYGDYDPDTIEDYRQDISSFTGASMLSDTPWVLQYVYTPWIADMGVEGHLDDDEWLYGTSIAYDDIGKAANISLDPEQKSTVPISVSNQTYGYSKQSGYKWWADETNWWSGITRPVGEFFGADPYTYTTGNAAVWNYTGYRYVFDPTLPFKVDENGDNEPSVMDGKLSLVWYTYNGQEGLSGGLDVYGGNVLLASYSAADIVSAYDSSSGYATTYKFNFEGTILNLSIRFNQEVIEQGTALMQAFSEGDWTMAITSVSAGNFLDLDDSISYSATMGSMISTFTQIYTFSLPSIDNPWMDLLLWLMVGLPMTLAMLLIGLRLAAIAAEAIPL